MADIKITDLAGYSNPVSTDVLPIVDVGNDLTKKVSIADLLENAATGSASAPAFAFDGDNDTGIYRPGANQVAISTGGTERIRILSSGKIGIGVTAQSSKLEVNGSIGIGRTAGGYTFRESPGGTERAGIRSSSSNDLIFNTGSANEQMRLTNSGVGIGTSSPSAPLDVIGKVQTSGGFFVGNTAGSSITALEIKQPSTVTSGRFIKLQISDAASAGDKYAQINATKDGVGTQNLRIKTVTTYNDGNFNVGGSGTSSPNIELNNNGSATFSGAVSKGSGSFRIDHPLKAETHQLVHSFVEGPQADNIYRGKVDLVAGTATVNIDTVAGMTEGTFVALNREIQCFTTNETGWTAIKGSVTGNVLTITAQENTCTDTISWLVIGERQDQHMYDTDWTDENGKVIVEPEKPVAASEAE